MAKGVGLTIPVVNDYIPRISKNVESVDQSLVRIVSAFTKIKGYNQESEKKHKELINTIRKSKSNLVRSAKLPQQSSVKSTKSISTKSYSLLTGINQNILSTVEQIYGTLLQYVNSSTTQKTQAEKDRVASQQVIANSLGNIDKNIKDQKPSSKMNKMRERNDTAWDKLMKSKWFQSIGKGIAKIAAKTGSFIMDLMKLLVIMAIFDPSGSMFTSIFNMAVNIGIQIVETIARFLPKLVITIANLIPKILETVGKALPKIMEALSTAVVALIDSFVKIFPMLITFLTKFIVIMVESILKVLPKIVTALATAIPILIEGLAKAGSFILKELIRLVPEILATVGTMFDILAKNSTGALKTLFEFLSWVATGPLQATLLFMLNNFKLIFGIWIAIIALQKVSALIEQAKAIQFLGIGGKVSKGLGMLGNSLKALGAAIIGNPIALSIIAIVGALIIMAKWGDKVATVLRTAQSYVTSFFDKLGEFGNIIAPIRRYINGLLEAFATLSESIYKAFKIFSFEKEQGGFSNALKSLALNIGTALLNFVFDIADNLLTFIGKLPQMAGQFFGWMFDKLGDLTSWLWDKVQSLFTGGNKEEKKTGIVLDKFFKRIINLILKNIANFITMLPSFFTEILKFATKKLKTSLGKDNPIVKIFESVTSVFQSIITWIKIYFSWDVLKFTFQNLARGVKNSFMNMGDYIMSFFSTIFSTSNIRKLIFSGESGRKEVIQEITRKAKGRSVERRLEELGLRPSTRYSDTSLQNTLAWMLKKTTGKSLTKEERAKFRRTREEREIRFANYLDAFEELKANREEQMVMQKRKAELDKEDTITKKAQINAQKENTKATRDNTAAQKRQEDLTKVLETGFAKAFGLESKVQMEEAMTRALKKSNELSTAISSKVSPVFMNR